MKLKPHQHPVHPNSYALSDRTYIVVGGTRWLMKRDNLPPIWGMSRFLSRTEAKEFAKTLTEESIVTPDQVKTACQTDTWS